MRLKFAFLGTWHSHASMHVREAVQRPDEVQLVGMYDSDSEVIVERKKGWAEYFEDIPVFDSVEAVLESEAEAVIVEGHVYQNLDYAEQALEAGKHVLLEKPAGVNLDQFKRIQKLGYEGPEAVLVLRALELAKKQGRSREETGSGLRRVLMQRFRGKALAAALQRWLKDPASNGRPEKPARGQRKPDKNRKPGKGNTGTKKSKQKMAGQQKMAGPGKRG